jgi:hypothetical protein
MKQESWYLKKQKLNKKEIFLIIIEICKKIFEIFKD